MGQDLPFSPAPPLTMDLTAKQRYEFLTTITEEPRKTISERSYSDIQAVPLGYKILGKETLKRKVFYRVVANRGYTIVAGISGTGKTTVVKNIAYHKYMRTNKKTVVLDPVGEYVGLKYMNEKTFYDTNEPVGSISDIKIIENVSVRFEDLDESKFLLLGLSEGSARFAEKIRFKYRNLHENNLYAILGIVYVYPSSDSYRNTNYFPEEKDWLVKYDGNANELQVKLGEEIKVQKLFRDELVHFQVKVAAKTAIERIISMGIIADEGTLEPNSYFVEQIPEIIKKYKVTVINMNNARNVQLYYTLLSTYILEIIEDVVDKLKPIMIIDEMDMIAPNGKNEVEYPTIGLIWNFVYKTQKLGLELIGIVQDTLNLHPSIAFGWQRLITAKLQDKSPIYNDYPKLRDLLYWQGYQNKRTMVLIDKWANNSVELFVPDPCPVQTWTDLKR